jgi:hypothetical protein
LQITILSATVETVPTAKGSYDKLELAFKDETGLVKGKKIMSFGDGATAFQALKGAQQGERYIITAEKKGEFWQWTKVNKDTSIPGAAPAISVDSSVVPKSYVPPAGKVTGSNYETPEERSKKQVYIVRQSSITAALNFLGGKAKSTTEVTQVAKEFESYVFDLGEKKPTVSIATQALLDMEDDIPL